MIDWAITHSPYIAAGFVGYAVGVIRAASVQLRREKLERWLEEQRRVNRVPIDEMLDRMLYHDPRPH